MTYVDSLHNELRRPRIFWARVYRWGGVALFGLACAGVGNAAGTVQFQVPWLQGRSATLHHVETHDIPKLREEVIVAKAAIPVGASSKPQNVTLDCPSTHARPQP